MENQLEGGIEEAKMDALMGSKWGDGRLEGLQHYEGQNERERW